MRLDGAVIWGRRSLLVVVALAIASLGRSQFTIFTVDASADRHPISPLVYGVNFATTDQANRLNLRLNRS